ncbi:MAG: sortase [Eggerthellaceae bacterium]|nr:sortase [Eggerthellaceae bacterium]
MAKAEKTGGSKVGRTIGNLLTAFGIVCILAALTLTGYNWNQSRAAGEESAHALDIMSVQLPGYEKEGVTGDVLDTEMPVVQIDGRSYVGRIDIPRLDISLPVLAEWSEEGADIAPCRYKGSVYNDTLIIAGHNFASHFGNLYQLADGDNVTFVDVNGAAYHYIVLTAETIDGYDLRGMEEGEWDLTLFTCNFSGVERTTVRCARVHQSSVNSSGGGVSNVASSAATSSAA